MKKRNHLGEEYVVEVIWIDGIKCRFCQRVIRVREKAAKFNRTEGNKTITEYECRECVSAGKDVKK